MSSNIDDAKSAELLSKELALKIAADKLQHMFQAVRLTLANGQSGVFTGQVLVVDPAMAKNCKVVNIEFTEPRPLPEGSSWGGDVSSPNATGSCSGSTEDKPGVTGDANA